MVLLIEKRWPKFRFMREDKTHSAVAYVLPTYEAIAVRLESQQLPAPKLGFFGYLVLLVACAGCASTSTFERLLPAEVPGPLRSFWRQCTTSTMLAAVELLRLGVLALVSSSSSSCSTMKRRPQEETPVAVIACVVCGFSLQAVCICASLLYVPTTVCLVLVNAAPAWLVAFSLVSGDRQHRLVVVGAAVGLVGTLVLCYDSLTRPPDFTDAKLPLGPPGVGVLVATVRGVGGAVYVAAARQSKLAPTRLMLLANVGSALVSLTLVALLALEEEEEEDSSVFTLDLADPRGGLFGFAAKGNFLESCLLSLFVDGIGVVGICLALQFLEPIVVAVAMQCEPVVAAAIDAFYGVGTLDSMTPATVAGSVVVVLGCALVVVVNALGSDETRKKHNRVSSSLLRPDDDDASSCNPGSQTALRVDDRVDDLVDGATGGIDAGGQHRDNNNGGGGKLLPSSYGATDGDPLMSA